MKAATKSPRAAPISAVESKGRVLAWEQVSLFGLVIVEKRRMNYSRKDSEDARIIFITGALGAFNDNVFKNGLAAMLVFNSAELAGLNTNQIVNLSAMVFILPFFLFSAIFGQFADKYEKSLQFRGIKLF